MGASTFFDIGKGDTAKKAFSSLVEQALYEYGHNGYSGTIAEKENYVMCGVSETEEEAMLLAEKMIDNGDHRIDDKWGPAGCIKIASNSSWLFFGWASC